VSSEISSAMRLEAKLILPTNTAKLALANLVDLYSAYERTLHVSSNRLLTNSRLTHFNGNKSEAIHRWFAYKEGFSSQLLPWVCKSFNLDLNSFTAILDPFAGVATSLLSAQLAYRGSQPMTLIGVERNPFVANVGRTKLNWQSFDLKRIARSAQKIAAQTKLRGGKKFEIADLSTLRNEQVFNRRRLYDLLFARELIKQTVKSGFDMDFLLLGWASIIESVSNVRKDGRALRFVDKDDRPPVHKLLEAKWSQMMDDIKTASKLLSKVHRGPVINKVFNADGRTLDILSSGDTKFDLILYSPPYLNNLDYSEVYKMELWLSEAISSQAEFRKLRLMTLRSHPSVTFPETFLVDNLPEMSWSRWLRDTLIELIPSNPRQKERIRTIRAYMDDMLLSLRSQRAFAQPDSLTVCVVGNSVHGTKEFPIPIATDLLIASLAQEAGFEVEKLEIARHTRRRDQTESALRESILMLRNPKASRHVT
jgi:hypothetical protein